MTEEKAPFEAGEFKVGDLGVGSGMVSISYQIWPPCDELSYLKLSVGANNLAKAAQGEMVWGLPLPYITLVKAA